MPSEIDRVPDPGLLTVTTTVDEYVFVAVWQSPAVATALMLQTGATEHEVGAVKGLFTVPQPARLTTAVWFCPSDTNPVNVAVKVF